MNAQRFFSAAVLTLVLFAPQKGSSAGLDPETILKKSDAMRLPQTDYTVMVRVTENRPNKEPKGSQFKALSKGRERCVVQTLAPAIDRGRVLLMNGNDFWAYLPNVSKPIRISLQEKLTGEVANGDLARANFSGDYEPTLVASKNKEDAGFYILDLKAKSETVTYGRVKLWVDKKTFRANHSEFYAFSGRILKTCTYENFKNMGGGTWPTKLVMRDAVNKDNYSVLTYEQMEVKPLPEKFFTKQYMNKFE